MLTWLVFISYNVLLLWLSVQPASGIPSWADTVDKQIHAVQYGLLCLIAIYAFRHFFQKQLTRKGLALAFLYSVSLGLVTELLQLARPDRTFSLADWLADGLGAAVVALLLFKKSLSKS